MDQLWSALTAIGTLMSALIIAVTVIMAARQVRLMQEQVRATNRNLEQLQRATQLDGVMEIFRELSAPHLVESGHFIRTDLVEKMKDPGFRASGSELVVTDTNVHKELIMMRLLERIGAIAKHGLIDPSVVFDIAHPMVTTMWETLEESGYFEMRRKAVGGPVWENFEYLVRTARRWVAENPGV